MPSILGKMRSSLRHSGEAWTPPLKVAELPDLLQEEREDDERLFARLKSGYPCEDVKHILSVATKHYRDLDEHIDFVQAWGREVREWSDTVTSFLPALPASQRSLALSLHAQVDTYLTLANMLALQHTQTGGHLKVAEGLLHHTRLWVNLGRDRTHKRFEDFERAADAEADGRHTIGGGGERRSFSQARRSRDDVAGNLEQIATFLNELTSTESRLPHLYNRLGKAMDRLVETQQDLDEMVGSIEAAKVTIEGLLDGSAWVRARGSEVEEGINPGPESHPLPAAAERDTATLESSERRQAPGAASSPTNSPAPGFSPHQPAMGSPDLVEVTLKDSCPSDEVGGALAVHSENRDSAYDPFHLDDS